MKTLYFLALFLVILNSCNTDPNDQVEEGQIVGGVYRSDEVGWSITTPAGFNITSLHKKEEINTKGLDAFKEQGVEVDMSGFKNLIGFEVNQFNTFISTSDRMPDVNYDEWRENNKLVNDLLYDTFTSQGIKVDTLSSTAKIDGLEFNVFETVVYAPNGKVILRLEMYNRLIDGYDFSATISYSERKYHNAMLKSLKESKFTKRGH